MERDESEAGRALRLPPWVPGPDVLPVAACQLGGRRGAAWVHWLTPALFVAAWAVAFAERLDPGGHVIGLFYPLAAIGVCCAALPVARAARRSFDARTVHTLYRALLSLAPWLAFAWPLSARTDSDGGAGGARAVAVLPASAFVMLLVLPVTIGFLRTVWRRTAAHRAVAGSWALLVVLMIASTWQALSHRTAEGLAMYRPSDAPFEREVDDPRQFVMSTHTVDVVQRREGARCVTGFAAGPRVEHACSVPARVYERPGRWHFTDRSWLRTRPAYHQMVFVRVGDVVLNNKHPARFMLFVAPPWEWIVGAALGLAVALCTLLRTRAALAAWAALPTRAGVARDGFAHCQDGTVVPLPGALAGLKGDVVVVGEGALAASAFRGGAGGGLLVVPGDLADWARARADCEAVATSFALAVLWLPAAPLVAAPWMGMFAPLPITAG